MKRVGLLTVHHSYNYGGALQAYATYKLIERLKDVEVEFVDFENETFVHRRQLFMPFNSLMNFLRNIRSLVQCHRFFEKKRNFENFYDSLKKSSIHWLGDIDWSEKRYDIVIVGSDQTFSLYLTGNPKEMKPFFLEHLYNTPKVSFASSMGEYFHKITGDDKKWLAERWKEFNYISVREDRAADFIEECTGRRPDVILDPTLLLEREHWEGMIDDSSPVTCEYIAYYSVLSSAEAVEYVKRLSEQMHLPVVALHTPTRFEISSKFKYLTDSGPSEFLKVIRNAKYVVTTSFHGTVFAIQFHKQFQSIVLEEGNRLKTLLGSLGLKDRLVEPADLLMTDRMEDKIDYKNVDIRLTEKRSECINTLNSIVENA